ncbi:hypothetical protein KR51_00000100 [Rubidibacter lacunae KORDI 51-2]|uniref:Polyhydroxyalkanoate synthesis regulator phasin n=1 Tax=Rubidibacter lacunae KORDI 51-2 TaxID=582515 RepID=U5DN93_9CHRO|nr:hypothetical protein [Rubidibacter lacunae]ERN43121.1 hypothetical protein KR51_00000100 [Rubidibacter lacunae KORDI 51-2]
MGQNRFGDFVQKAFYLGVGIADFAQEKASETLQDLRGRGQQLADEMVRRGEMSSEEARRFVDDLVREAQQRQPGKSTDAAADKPTGRPEPRQIEIEILEDEELPASAVGDSSNTAGGENLAADDEDSERLDSLRQQVDALREELRRLQQ